MTESVRELQNRCVTFAKESRNLSGRSVESVVADCVDRLGALPAATVQQQLVCVRSLVLGLQRRPLETSTLLRDLKERRRRLTALLRVEAQQQREARSNRLKTVLGDFIGATECVADVARYISDKEQTAPVDSIEGGLSKVGLSVGIGQSARPARQ